MRQLIQERTRQIHDDIANEAEQSDQTVETLRDYLQTQVPQLYDSLKQSISSREAMEEGLGKQISEEFAVVQERLAQEKYLRETQEA